MNRRDAMAMASVVMAGALLKAGEADAQNEMGMHPRLAAAIRALEDARAYLQAAPHDFGGHKAAAIQSIDAALIQLRFSLAYRANRDMR